jgi:hypothetical protein
MNYKKIHDDIIQRAKNRKLSGYSEKHHIILKSMGGTNKNDNLVKLTAKEHFVIHKLLVQIYPNEIKFKKAFWMMCGKSIKHTGRNFKISSKEYDIIKKEHSKIMSKIMLTNNPSKKDEVKEKLRIKATGRKFSDEINKKKGKVGDDNISKRDDVRKKISDKLKGNIMSDETKQKISKSCKEWSKTNTNPFKGKSHKKETIEYLSQLNGTPITIDKIKYNSLKHASKSIGVSCYLLKKQFKK